MDYQTKLSFNCQPPVVMHIDLNSCFASIEQQANPLLRHKPVVVAAYSSPNGCVLSPSVEAKRVGIKVGMRVREACSLFPKLIVLTPDPDKYRAIHLQLRQLLSNYSPHICPKSIDEFVLDLSDCPCLKNGIFEVAKEIKLKIKQNIGDYLTVSIGFGPSRFLAKIASNLHKPDGLDEINSRNFYVIYRSLSLVEIHGINHQNANRLNSVGIYTVTDFFRADLFTLRQAFGSIVGYRWFLRLRGWEVDGGDSQTKSFSHSYSPSKVVAKLSEISPVLSQLVQKVGFRMRDGGFQAKGVGIGLLYHQNLYFHQVIQLDQPIFSSEDIYRVAYQLVLRSPYRLSIKNISISCFKLSDIKQVQLDIFGNRARQSQITLATDEVNHKYGQFTIASATIVEARELVRDYISFGQAGGISKI